MTTDQSSDRSTVFLSYSRRNSAIADELNISLESHGFDVSIDREDLFPGERWEPRLQAMIAAADTTVCAISPEWVASSECRRELSIALENGRRVIPVIIDEVQPEQLPPELARLQLVFFHGAGASFARGMASLVAALRTDISWVRAQSRLLDRATAWEEANRSAGFLLRGLELARAQRWSEEQRPSNARVLPIVGAYIEASLGAEQATERSRARAQRRTQAALAIGVVLVAGLGGVVLFQQQQLALANAVQRADALQNTVDLSTFAEAPEAEAPSAIAAAEIAPQTSRSAGSDATGEETRLEQGGEDPLTLREVAPKGQTSASEDDAEDGIEDGIDAADQIAQREVVSAVRALNAPSKSTRLGAGQEVASLVRGAAQEQTLTVLIAALEGARLDRLSPSGRFNILYMLNVYDDWAKAPWAPRLSAALDRIEAPAASGYGVGAQTQDCIDRLRAKLAGKTGVGDRCGAVRKSKY